MCRYLRSAIVTLPKMLLSQRFICRCLHRRECKPFIYIVLSSSLAERNTHEIVYIEFRNVSLHTFVSRVQILSII